MDPVLALQLIKLVYGSILRPLVKDAVEDSATPIDDAVLETCDSLFRLNISAPDLPLLNK